MLQILKPTGFLYEPVSSWLGVGRDCHWGTPILPCEQSSFESLPIKQMLNRSRIPFATG